LAALGLNTNSIEGSILQEVISPTSRSIPILVIEARWTKPFGFVAPSLGFDADSAPATLGEARALLRTSAALTPISSCTPSASNPAAHPTRVCGVLAQEPNASSRNGVSDRSASRTYDLCERILRLIRSGTRRRTSAAAAASNLPTNACLIARIRIMARALNPPYLLIEAVLLR